LTKICTLTLRTITPVGLYEKEQTKGFKI